MGRILSNRMKGMRTNWKSKTIGHGRTLEVEAQTSPSASRFILLFLLILAQCARGDSRGTDTLEVTVKDVVSETEEGFVSTDKGMFALPASFNAVAMDDSSFNKLVLGLKQSIGPNATVSLVDSAVVGISCPARNLVMLPQFTMRKQKTYDSAPTMVKTKLLWWDEDSYGLTVVTSDGRYCVFHEY